MDEDNQPTITWGGLVKGALYGVAAIAAIAFMPSGLSYLSDTLGTEAGTWAGDAGNLLEKAATGLSSFNAAVVKQLDPSILGTMNDDQKKQAFTHANDVWGYMTKGSGNLIEWFGNGSEPWTRPAATAATIIGGKWIVNKVTEKQGEASWREREASRRAAYRPMPASGYAPVGYNGGGMNYSHADKVRQEALQRLSQSQNLAGQHV